jgi:hypothetical protein
MTKDALYEQLRVININISMKRVGHRIQLGALKIEQKYKLLTKLSELYDKLDIALSDSGLDDAQIMVLAKNEWKRWVERDPMFRPNFATYTHAEAPKPEDLLSPPPPQSRHPTRRLDLFED